MKRLVGGDYLLDLSSIELEESVDGTTKTNITDSDVLEQLTNLKKYIKNPEMAKPVWVKLVNGENDELVIARGTFAVVDTGEFEICVQLNGYKLVISVEFTQVTLDDNTPIDDWYIDTNDAKYLFTSDAQNIGAISELPIFENIVDANGHKRFIEGNGNPVEIEGVTITYNKWSLSGTHLMFVIAGNVVSGTSLAFGCDFTLPKWIYDKIYPIFGGSILSIFKMVLTDNSWNTQEVNAYFGKASDNKVSITQSSGATEITSDKSFRIQYDLLIDNEPEQAGE